jgi:hypothetical protein
LKIILEILGLNNITANINPILTPAVAAIAILLNEFNGESSLPISSFWVVTEGDE